MTDDFKMKSPSLKALQNFYKKLGKKQFRFAMAGFLNALAWDMKNKRIPNTLQDDMNIRDPKFMHRSIRVVPAKPSQGNNMESVVGTVKVGKFRGYEEQQYGKPSKTKNRVHTLMSQVGGTEKGKISGPKRLKSVNQVIDPLKIDSKFHKTPGQKTTSALHGMRNGKIKRMVQLSRKGMVGRLKNLKSGIYQGVKKQVQRIWNFEKRQDSRKIPWMNDSLKVLHKKFDKKREMKKQVKKQIKFKKR